MECIKCKEEIHPLRIKAIPSTRVCVKCSSEQKVYGRNIISGKTEYAELEVIERSKVSSTLITFDRRTGFGSNLYKARK